MEHPTIPARIVTIAGELSLLPPELHEAILAQLRFCDIILLSLAPTANSVLLSSIRNSFTWRWAFSDNLDQLQRSWSALDHLAWNFCRLSWLELWHLDKQVADNIKFWDFKMTSPELKSSMALYKQRMRKHSTATADNDDDGTALSVALQNTFHSAFRVFMGPRALANYCVGLQTVWVACSMSNADRRGIALFLPKTVRDALVHGDVLPRDWDANIKWEDCLRNSPDEYTINTCATALYERQWTVEEAITMLPILRHSVDRLREAQSAELMFMKELYDLYPLFLKGAQAPNSPRENVKHIAEGLARDAQSANKRRLTHFNIGSSDNTMNVSINSWYRFRHPHMTLIPYNWCIQLFDLVIKRQTVYPEDIQADIITASAGFDYVKQHGLEHKSRRRVVAGIPGDLYYLLDLATHDGCPHPFEELHWLKSFLVCVNWMNKAFPDEARRFQETALNHAPIKTGNLGKTAGNIMSGEAYSGFIASTPPKELARYLFLDSRVCDEIADMTQPTTTLPSLLALYMHSFPSSLAKEVAQHMMPSDSQSGTRSIQQMIYEQIIEKITGYLTKPYGLVEEDYEDSFTVEEEQQKESKEMKQQTETKERTDRKGQPEPAEPTENNTNQNNSSDILNDWAKAKQEYLHAMETKKANSRRLHAQKRQCYICRFRIDVVHETFPAMCIPCGNFNLSGSQLTMPNEKQKSFFRWRIAVVTGGRINLGFHVALRLLRLGATVIVTTRYPNDAIQRYMKQPDWNLWLSQIHILGADFRSSADVFATVGEIKKIISAQGPWSSFGILINNAAQTLTDSIHKEEIAIEREKTLREKDIQEKSRIRWHNPSSYTARVRGGMSTITDGLSALRIEKANAEKQRIIQDQNVLSALRIANARKQSTVQDEDDLSALVIEGNNAKQQNPIDDEDGLATISPPSSWVQTLSEIPYNDVISAHSINTFTPLILLRELSPLMQNRRGNLADYSAIKPEGHVINVSSREGIFEDRRNNSAKRGKHVHTNMSKAGLNMITETEAEVFWKKKRIAINTVDPGYMSAAPECAHFMGGERPIGWEDGAGRVLWPIEMMEAACERGGDESDAYWGRFYKHYGAVRVDPRYGRG